MKLTSARAALMLGVAAGTLGASAPALAQSGANASVDSGEIIVTARRVEERLQDVPISITVFSQDQLDKRNVTAINDLVNYTPSLSINERYGPEKASFAIRGFNSDANTAPTVAVYFADVVGVRGAGNTTSGNVVGAGAFMDLQNVQVLKGPQGTLFGRNTNGGAVLLVPTKPTGQLEGYIEGTIGNYDARRVQGVLNVPVNDTFRVRAAFDRNKRDGYMRNRSGIGPKDYNDTDYFAGRLSVVADLTPNLENYMIAHYSRSNTNGYGARVFACDRTLTVPANGAVSVRGLYGIAACNQIDRQGSSPLDIEYSIPDPYVLIEQWQIINTTTWQASDSLTIKNIMSYGQFRERTHIQLFGGNFRVPANVTGIQRGAAITPVTPGSPAPVIILGPKPGQDSTNQSTFTEELQLQGDGLGGRLKYVLGGYLEFSRPLGVSTSASESFTQCRNPDDLSTCVSIPGSGNISDQWNQVNFDNHGIFAQGTFNFTEKLALTLGGRYTFDKIVASDKSIRITVPPSPGVLPTCRDSFRHFTIVAGRRVALPVTNRDQCLTVLTEKSSEPTWLVNLDYKPTPDVMLYAKYARGYRQGGITFTTTGIETWKPEKVDAYEIGAKASFRGAVSGYFNIAAFYNDYTDQQIQATPTVDAVNFPQVTGGTVIINAGSSRIQGIDVDASATFFDSLNLTASYTYLDTLLKSIDTSGINLVGTPYTAVVSRTAKGGPLNFAPKHKLSVSATYTLPIPEELGRLSIGAVYSYTSKQEGDTSLTGFAAQFGQLGPRNLLNLNLDWKGVGGSPVDLSVFATNITNDLYRTTPGTGYQSFGYVDTQYGPPRMYGVRLRYNFGE
ncbi:MAG TPA: TonB-dependent receptor [Novosphingobium sp.]